MGESAGGRSSWKNVFGGVMQQITSRTAPLIAPYMPERFYELYRESSAAARSQLQVLDGLPPATMQLGYMPLLLCSPDRPKAAMRAWDALSLSPRLLILGPVGSGKSTLLCSLAWRFASQIDQASVSWLTFKLFGRSVKELMPLLIDLRGFGQNSHTLLDTMLDSMAQHGFPNARDFLLERLQSGQCIVLLDGLDSLGQSGKQTQIAEMVSDYPRNIWVIAGRPSPDLSVPADFSIMELRGMASTDITTYVHHYLGRGSTGARGILAAHERSRSLAELAVTPLMIASMCRALRRGAVRAARLPMLYDACLDTLLGEWSKRTGYASRYDLADKLRLLERIAYEMQRQGRTALASGEIRSILTDQLPEAQSHHGEGLFEAFTRREGILRLDRHGGQEYAFCAATLRSHLAARWIVNADEAALLLPLADNLWWEDTIILTAGLLSEPGPFLYGIESEGEREPYKWFLLARCIAEAEECDDALRSGVAEQLCALLEEESDDNWQVAATAIAGMAREQKRDHFPRLIRESQDPEIRRRAALALGRLAQEWAIPSLGAAISDDDPRVRQQAAWALGYIPSAQAVHALPRALRSPFEGVREAAAKSLGRQGQVSRLTETVVSDLINALDIEREENVDVARQAEAALVEIGHGAVPQLIAALNNRRFRSPHRSRVARALGRLGDDRALPILIDAILSRRSEEAEGYIGAAVSLGEKAVPALVRALAGKDVTMGAGLVAALARIGIPAVEPLVEAIAGNLPEVRNAAVRALEQIGAPSIAPLTHALLHDSRYEVRRRALEVLGRIGEEHAVSALVEALSDSDRGVRINAVRHLGSLRKTVAVPRLIEILHEEDYAPLRREAISSLGAIGDGRAIPSLLGILAEPDLVEIASGALTAFGEDAVLPLVEALHLPETPAEVREALWDVIENVGARARSDDENLLGLASTYAQLREEDLSGEEILSLTSKLGWWEHGQELHRSLDTAQSLAGVSDLKDISECGKLFDWLPETPDWLRPHIKLLLWGLRDVVESITVFHSLTRRDSQRDALLSAIDRLEEIQEQVRSMTLSFEWVLLDRVATQWRTVIHNAIKDLRGRASLLINLLTAKLPLRGSQQVATAVFSLFNEGDSAARNLSVSLRPVTLVGDGIRVVGGERLNLDPLGIGEEREVEIGIAPNGVRAADLVFETRYDDDERQDVSHRFSCTIAFWDLPSTYTPIQRSPYIVGMPVKTAEMFYGRQDIFEWVRDNISGQHQEQPLLIYGERRMGKTSVLYQLQRNPPTPNHICLLFDLQLYGYIDNTAELLFELASAMVVHLQREGMDIADPDWDEYGTNPHRAFRLFCDFLDDCMGERRIVVMMDEFGVLMSKVRDGVFDASLFDYLRGVTQRSNKFTFLFTGAYEVRRMQQDFDSILFNMPKVRKISYLSEGEATNLIEKPIEGLLTYHPLVVQKIRRVTACHPYFVQYICDELVKFARRERTNYVQLTDLDFVIHGVVQDATGNIENSIYNYLAHSEKAVLAAMAHVTDDVRVFVPLGDIAGMLERRQLSMPREQIMQALQALKERDLVTEMRIGQQLRFSFRMGLVRLWLRQNEILLRLGQEAVA